MPFSRFSRILQGPKSSTQDLEQENTQYPSVVPSEQHPQSAMSQTAQTLLALYPKEGTTVGDQSWVKTSTNDQWADQDKQKAQDKWTTYTLKYPGRFDGVVESLEKKLSGGTKSALEYLESLADGAYLKKYEEEKGTQATSAADPGLSELLMRQQQWLRKRMGP